MATSTFDSSGAQRAARPRVTRHPAFPAVVALWAACLLGAGCVVVPAALLERVVTATGIAALIPAATPPLGSTTRGAIALAAALAGALVGLALARRVARARDDAAAAPGARRPLHVGEDLGSAGGFAWAADPLPAHAVSAAGQSFRDEAEPMDLEAEPSPARLRFAVPAASGEPDLVQLVRNLGASIERRRQRQQTARVRVDPATAVDAAQAWAADSGEPDGDSIAPSPAAPAGQAATDAALRAALASVQRTRRSA